MSKRKYITEDQRLTADAQIKSLQRQINYDTKDYTVELVVQKFKKDEFFIPDYQRGFVWKEKNKSSFIESVLLGLPIPFMFFADCVHGHAYYYDFANDHNIQYYMLMLDKLIERMNLKLVGFNDEEIKTFCSY